MLAISANRLVLNTRLIDGVWPDCPPATARSQIQGCVSVLRKQLRGSGIDAEIHTRSAGYELTIADEMLDLHQFESAVHAARAHADRGELDLAVTLLREALGLWRGPALQGVPSEVLQRAAAPLDEARLSATDELMRMELARGRHGEIIGELRSLVTEHPLHEQSYANLILSLYRSGRAAEALDVMREARSLIAAELGLDPSPTLRHLEHQVLTNDPALDLAPVVAPAPAAAPGPAPTSDPPTTHSPGPAEAEPPTLSSPAPLARATPTATPGTPVSRVPDYVPEQLAWGNPRQLPRADADFVGRVDLVDSITGLLRAIATGDHAGQYALPIVGIYGPGGIGKTTLALRVAHQVVDAFPDGNLYVDLHGPAAEEGVGIHLARLLRALGINGSAIPAGAEERSDLFRSLMAGRKILLIINGVTSEEQVTALLPGSTTSAVLINCRSRLDLLSGTRWFGVEAFDAATSHDLLARIVGEGRLRREPEATARLIEYAGGLPLALRIAGARIASRQSWRIAELTRRMENEVRRLDEFSHRGLELRSSLGTSYRSLPDATKRLFRRLSLSHVRSFPGWAASAVLDVDLPEAERRLDQLIDADLLEAFEAPSGESHYRFHDLIRIYAHELLLDVESPQERQEAFARLFGGWLSCADRAHRAEYGGDFTILHGQAPRYEVEVTDERLEAAPLDWLDDHRAALVDAVRQAAELGLDEITWDLALTLVSLFEVRGLYDDWRETATVALSATQRAGNRLGRAASLYSLGALTAALKDVAPAAAYLEQALEIFVREGNEHGQALALRTIALLDRVRGDVVEMREHLDLALVKMRAVGDLIGEANILRTLAREAIDHGDITLAASMLEEALGLTTRAGYRRGTAQMLTTIAELRLAAGRPSEARDSLTSILDTVQTLGDRVGEAHVLYLIGVTWLRDGNAELAEATLLAARAVAARAGVAVVEGQAEHALGEMLTELGEADVALGHVDRAVEIFRSLGSTTRLARSLLLLRQIETRPEQLARLGGDLEAVSTALVATDSPEATRLLEELAPLVPRTSSGSGRTRP